MKLFLYLIFVITFSSAVEAVTYNKKINTAKSWRKINLIYSHDFTSQNYWSTPIPADCFFVFDSSAATGFTFKPVLRCTEHISLLRSDATATHWQREQNQHGFFIFNLPDTGIHHVHARIKSILPSAPSLNGNSLTSESLISKNDSTITGVFKRHSSNVKSWLFKTLSTGKLSTIHATPTHQFYVKYLNEWLPLSKITSDMTLIDSQNNTVSLVCHGKNKHCGIPWHPGRMTTIYNIEVYKKHDYFAGEQMLLVHNCGMGWLKSRIFAIFKTQKSHAAPLPVLDDNQQNAFLSASNRVIHVLKGEEGTVYNDQDDFFNSVEKAVKTCNAELEEADLPFMAMDIKTEMALDFETQGCNLLYHKLTFSLHDNPDSTTVTVPFSKVRLNRMGDGRYLVHGNNARSYINIGDLILTDGRKQIRDGKMGLVDNKPSDFTMTPTVHSDLFKALFKLEASIK